MKKAFQWVSLAMVIVFHSSWAATFVVDNIGDADNMAVYTLADGSNTLRKCVRLAMNLGGANTIQFNLGGAAPHTINITNGMFNLYGGDLTIDASTQAGWAGNPIVVLRGNGTGNAVELNGARVTLRGLIFQNYQNGIVVNNNLAGNVIENCWFGISADGNTKTGNTITEYGIFLRNGVTNFRIGSTTTLDQTTRVVVSGCNRTGIYVFQAGNGIVISNAYVGTNAAGNAGLGNGLNEAQNHHGIDVQQTQNVQILNSVVSYNYGAGIEIRQNSHNAIIRNNKIGTDANGNVPLGNFCVGIRARTSNGLTIGGTTAAERNIISANGNPAVPNGTSLPTQYDWYNMCGIYAEDCSNMSIAGNYVGTDNSGNATSAALGNFYTGIKLVAWNTNACENNTIGGATANHRNVIGGNGQRGFAADANYPGHGVQFQTNVLGNNENNFVQNNYIGIGANGTAGIGNYQDGISLFGFVRNIFVGGNGLRNIISNNRFGIFIQNNCQSNFIRGNYIGTNAAGTAIAPNTQGGVCVQWNSTGNYIGRDNTGEGNTISGNAGAPGIIFREGNGGFGNNNFVYNNIIGLQPDGTTPLLSTNSYGVLIQDGCSGNRIGGSGANQRNIISGNLQNGVYMNNGDNNFVINNYVGLDVLGNSRPNLNSGIVLENGSSGNTLGEANGGNVISRNTNYGIRIVGAGSFSNIVRGNLIGTNLAGTASLPNNIGVSIMNVNASSALEANIIGGLAAGERNLVSGNNTLGIQSEASPYTVITGNLVGTNLAGTAAVANGTHGIEAWNNSHFVQIIGNLVSGNGNTFGNGISVTNSNNLTVRSNLVGVNSTATAAIPNRQAGYSSTNSNNTIIGGSVATQRNVFSGNGDPGIYMANCDNTLIQGNYIGVGGVSGNLPIGNTTSGIYITSNVNGGSVDNFIGGLSAAEKNFIGHNGANGVVIDGATSLQNAIRQNEIFCNALRGIVLSNGSNNGIARPTLTILPSGDIQVSAAAGTFIEVFTLDGCNDCGSNPTSDKLQGKTYVTTLASGSTFTPTAGTIYTATASSGNSSTPHNTSEFSTCYVACLSHPIPTSIVVNGGERNVCETFTGSISMVASGGQNYEWLVGGCLTGTIIGTGATLTLSSAPSSTTVYYVRSGANGACPPSDCIRDSIVIHQAPSEPTSINGVGPSCEGTTGNFTLQANGGVANGAVLRWYSGACGGTGTLLGNGNGLSQAIPANTTAYFVRYESLYCGNTNCASTTYTIHPQATPLTGINLSTDRHICSDFPGNITLTAGGLASSDNMEWFLGNCGTGTSLGNANPAVLTSAQFTNDTLLIFVRSTSAQCGPTQCVMDTLFIHTLPVLPSSISINTPSACRGASGTLQLSATNNGGERLRWALGACNGSILGEGTSLSLSMPAVSSTYYVFAESAYCPNSLCASVDFTLNENPTPSIVGGATICQSADSTYSTAASGNSFAWSFAPASSATIQGSGNSITAAITASGILTLIETNTTTNCSTEVTKAITMQVPNGPPAIAGNDFPSCVTELTLGANSVSGTWSAPGLSGVVFSPSTSIPNPTVSGLIAGINKLVWSTEGSCGYEAHDTLVITVGPSSLEASIAAPSDTQCVGAPREMRAQITSAGSGNYTYVWASSDNSINLTTTSTDQQFTPGAGQVEIYLTVIDNQNLGCMFKDTASLFTVGDQELVIPNLITPNGDGKNDYFELKDRTDQSILPGSYLEVTNRWGQFVYKDKSYANTWKADDANDGVYFYYLKTGCGNRDYKGWVQVLR